MSHILRKIIFFTVVILLPSITCTEIASATNKMLMLYPIRLIFTDRQRSISARIINQGTEPITYSISIVTMRKGSDGRLYEPKSITDEEQMIKKIIRYSPRRATIEPHKSQVVKLMLRKPKHLLPGEYRTFIQLTPHPAPAKIKSNTARQQEGNAVNLDIIVKSTMPIVIQHDIPMGSVKPIAVNIPPSPAGQSGSAISVTLEREGVGSAFGNISLEYASPVNPNKYIEVGKAQGVAIYAPDIRKTITINLNEGTNVTPGKGVMRVVFQYSTGLNTRRQSFKKSRLSKKFPL